MLNAAFWLLAVKNERGRTGVVAINSGSLPQIVLVLIGHVVTI